MKKNILLCVYLLIDGLHFIYAQNLVLNPGAESSPNGTLWNIVSAGGAVCAVGTAASTYSNWTMVPDNSANYPSAHGGTHTFYAGCSATVPAGPFELYQDISVVADAVQIDAGNVTYIFSGYIQTPVSPQSDGGRFILDFLNASGSTLGVSYTSVYQSFAAGSGGGWILYSNTRSAPAGTRKLRIRLQSTISTGPAINAYFDDISVIKSVTLPVVLESFKGIMEGRKINLEWLTADAVDFSRFEVDKSRDATEFLPLAEVNYAGGQTKYIYSDQQNTENSNVYYRLKLIDIDGKYVYSNILAFHFAGPTPFDVSPNPANSKIEVSGIHENGTILIVNMDGKVVFQKQTNNNGLFIDVSSLSTGVYIITYNNSGTIDRKKLLIQR